MERVLEEIREIRQDMRQLRAEMNSRFNNIYVLIGATWVTTIGAVIGLYFR